MLNGRDISTNIFDCIQTENKVCLVLEYIPGGDLFQQYERSQGGYLTEDVAVFYAATTLILLE
jgi:serine/threonine protein kinase